MTALGKRGLCSSGGPGEDLQKPWMVKMQSPRVQCCLCTCCILSALVGMCMLSVGVCLVLNYNLLDVDTSGLPSNLHNDQGKKVVGILLTVAGVVSVVISAIVSTLYFTVCSRRSSHTAVGPNDGKDQDPAHHPHHHHHHNHNQNGARGAQGARPSSARGNAQGSRPSSRENQAAHLHHHHHFKHLHGGNGGIPGRNSPNLRRSSGAAGAVPVSGSSDPMNRSLVSLGKDGPTYSRSNSNSSSSGIKVSRGHHHHHRRGKKGRQLAGRHYKNPLAPHPEEAAGADSQSLGESRRSASLSSSRARRLQGEVNHGMDLEEDLEMTQESVASGGSSESSSTISRSVLITVDPSQGSRVETSPARGRSHHRRDQETGFNTPADTPRTIDSDRTVTSQPRRSDNEIDDDYDDDDDDEDESGRMSRSTMDSLEMNERMPAEGSQAAQKRLDSQIQQLVNS